jgi:hypothetical protein
MNTDIQLTSDEIVSLAHHESIIEGAKIAFELMGRALCTIRDNRLYRQQYGTFEEYCQKRWGFSSSFAHKQINSSEVAEDLRTIVHISNEGTAREFVSVPPEDRPAVAQKAKAIAESKGRDKINSRDVKEAKQEAKPASEPHKVEVIEPEPEAEPIEILPPAPPEIKSDLETWLANMPLMKQLSGIQKRKFEESAKLYFAYQNDIRELGNRFRRRINGINSLHRSRYMTRVMTSFEINDPSFWLLCGECKGTGWNGTKSQCSSCNCDGFQPISMAHNNRKAVPK